MGSNDYYVNRSKTSLGYPIVRTEGENVYIALDFVAGFRADVAEFRHLSSHRSGNILLRAEDEDVGLDTDGLQLLHGMLGRFGLQLLRRFQIRDVCQMDAQGIPSEFPFQLAHSLKDGGGFDVADGASDLCDYEVELTVAAKAFYVVLDFIGDMRDYLDCLTQIVATALLFDYRFINSAGGDIIGTGGVNIGEAFVVTEVEVGFMTVDGDVAFTMLIGVECTRIDIDVGIEFLNSDRIAS